MTYSLREVGRCSKITIPKHTVKSVTRMVKNEEKSCFSIAKLTLAQLGCCGMTRRRLLNEDIPEILMN